MNKLSLLILFICFYSIIQAQNLYPKKLNNCNADEFCLDCGDTKANVDEGQLLMLLENLATTNNLTGISGQVSFQILLDSNGHACVLSHTDVSDNIISRNIVTALNSFHGWVIAKSKGKNEARVSFNMNFTIRDGKINAIVDRVDIEAFTKGFDHPTDPEIYNKKYTYKNEHLKKYKITVWNSSNSILPDDLSDNITADKNDIIWYQTDKNLFKFQDNKFIKLDKTNSPFNGSSSPRAMTTDNSNTKWFDCNDSIYSYNNSVWAIYDSSQIGIKGSYKIINNKNSGEVFFCSDNGLLIYKAGKWVFINKDKIKQLPSNRICFAKRDLKNRLWIGTFSGSVMIDENGKVTSFNSTNTILKGKCIDSMDEDKDGNIYFGLYEYNDKKGERNANEGIAVLSSNGEWKQYTTSNSGIPHNHTEAILYDGFENVLWIATAEAGLVRYDLKGNWENYHNKNSDIPTSYISNITQDSKGAIYLATRYGMVKMEKK